MTHCLIISHVKNENKTIAVAAAEDFDIVKIVSECKKMDQEDFILVMI